MEVLRIAIHVEEVIENTAEVDLSPNKPEKEVPDCHDAKVILMDSKSFSHRTFLKIVMKFVFTGKGNLQKVKKIK